MPILRCPIPESPAKILSARSTGDHFSDFENQFNSFAKAATGDIPVVDGIDYASTVLGKLANLADEIAGRSPVAPEMMVFDSSNIIGVGLGSKLHYTLCSYAEMKTEEGQVFCLGILG